MVSEDKVITVESKCACGKTDTENSVKSYFRDKCSVCGKEGVLVVETLDNVEVDSSGKTDTDKTNESTNTSNESSNSEEQKEEPLIPTADSRPYKIVCKNCGAEFCGQDGYDLSGGTRASLTSVNPDEITGSEDELSTNEEEDTTYMSGWEGLCDLLRPLDAEAMIIQRGDYVIVRKIDMPQSASLWAYEGINVIDESVTVTDYTPEIYNTFVIRWGESFDNELEFTFNKHKQLFGERKQILEAKKVAVVDDEKEGEEGEDSKKDKESSGGIFDLIFGTDGAKEKQKKDKDKTKDKDKDKEENDDEEGEGSDKEAPDTEEVPITTKEEAIQFGLKQVGKAKREDGHTIELKVIGSQHFMVGEWCHVKLPSFNEDVYMFISKCSFESSPDSEYINSLTLVDYPPSLGKPMGSTEEDEEDSGEEGEEENTEDTENTEDSENSENSEDNS